MPRTFLFTKVAFDFFEAFGPFTLNFLLKFFGKRRSAPLSRNSHGNIITKVHAGWHNEITIEVVTGVLEEECSRQLRDFFRKRREENKTLRENVRNADVE